MTQPKVAPTYIPGLDGLRAVSILIVFVAHAGLGHVVPGGFGVTVFFFLSGFLITSLLIREYDTYKYIAIPAFYLRRALRLLPPLLVTLGLAIFAVILGYAQGKLAPGAIISQVFFFFNYYVLSPESGTSVSGLNVLWSLSVEEQFYLIFPFCFIALTSTRWQIPSIALAVAAILIWRIIRFNVFLHSSNAIYISTDTRMDSILFGCLLALISARHPDTLRSLFKRQHVVLALALVALLASFLIRDPIFRSTFRYTLQGLALMPIFYLAVNRPESPLFSWLNWRPMRRLGQYSYTFYLAHFVIIKMLIFNGMNPENLIVFMLIAFALSAIYSDLVFRLVEKPLQPLRARLTGH